MHCRDRKGVQFWRGASWRRGHSKFPRRKRLYSAFKFEIFMAPAFVTPTFVLGQSCRQSKTCHRRLVFTATAQGTGSSNWGNGSNSGGPSVPSGRIQTLEFTIRPGGTVEEKVLGIKGKHCEKVSSLVHVVSRICFIANTRK